MEQLIRIIFAIVEGYSTVALQVYTWYRSRYRHQGTIRKAELDMTGVNYIIITIIFTVTL